MFLYFFYIGMLYKNIVLSSCIFKHDIINMFYIKTTIGVYVILYKNMSTETEHKIVPSLI